MDDFGLATQQLQGSAMHLLSERRVGHHKISDKVTFILATNNKGEMAGVNGILEPVKSRCVTILKMEPDATDWLRWAVGNGIRPEVTGFIRLRPELLWDFMPSNDFINSPSPRTVEHVNDILNMELPRTVSNAMIYGSIGDGFSREFLGFLKLYDNMVDPDFIINNPEEVEIPNDNPSLIYAYMSALTYRVNPKNFDNIVKFARRLSTEYNVKLVHYDLIAKNPKLVNSKTYIDWVVDFQEYF
jgi:hypothetical protein